MNIDLPEIFSNKNTFNNDEKVIDNDEKINIEHAISESIIIDYKNKDNKLDFFDDICIDDYDAIIDTIGLFKNYDNKVIAIKIHNYFKNLRIIIFIDRNNDIFLIDNNKIKSYNEETNYNNPFIYYDQSHIVGVDIKQDYYPKMNGLCIVNDKSEYTTVAQSMCRLRKLNMGHIITFLYIGQVDNFLDKINLNEIKSKESKYNNLIYQTLKSEIRKLKMVNDIECFKENYIEDVKFYYLENQESKILNILNNKNVEYNKEDFLGNIIEIDETNKNIIKLFDKINNLESLKQLVYNIDSISIETSIDSNEENDEEKSKNKQKSIDEDQKEEFIQVQYHYIKEFDYYIYNFSNLETDFFNNTIKINENIRHLPNILNIASHSHIEKYNKGLLFVLFEKYNTILIIPFYLIIYFYNDYHIFDKKLNKINFKIGDYNIDHFKELNFFKIFAGKEINSLNEYCKTYEAHVLYIILPNTVYNTTFISSQIEFIRKMSDSINQKFIEEYNDQLKTLDECRQKYLKYKNK
jgi:hypothetical protein